MSDRAAAQRLGIAGLVGLLVFGAASAFAQTGSLRGVVVDSAGFPVSGAEISILSLSRVVRTDSLGRLLIGALPEGDLDVSIRRLGYHQQTRHVLITGAGYDSIKVTLVADPVALAQMDVTAFGRHPFFQGFDQRRSRGIGTFVTREQIDARNTSTPSDLLRTVPQVRVVRVGAGMGVRFTSNQLIRGRGANLCMPTIWVDGQRALGMEIDDLRANDIEGIELYRGASTTPPQFATMGLTQCGAIVVWTRRRG